MSCGDARGFAWGYAEETESKAVKDMAASRTVLFIYSALSEKCCLIDYAEVVLTVHRLKPVPLGARPYNVRAATVRQRTDARSMRSRASSSRLRALTSEKRR